MNQQQTTLTQLLGSKELTMGCILKMDCSKLPGCDENSEPQICEHVFYKTQGLTNHWVFFRDYNFPLKSQKVRGVIEIKDEWERSFEIIGHPAKLHDFHKWLNEKNMDFEQSSSRILWSEWDSKDSCIDDGRLEYDSYLSLLDQKPEVLQKIIDFITNNS